MSIFNRKSKIQRDCEKIFRPLEDAGFERSFGDFGTEKTLTYKNIKKQIQLIWETNSGNPWVLFCMDDKEIDLTHIRKTLLQQAPSDLTEHQKQYWLYNILDRSEYLQKYLEEILKSVKQ